jgi:hypothetical protein
MTSGRRPSACARFISTLPSTLTKYKNYHEIRHESWRTKGRNSRKKEYNIFGIFTISCFPNFVGFVVKMTYSEPPITILDSVSNYNTILKMILLQKTILSPMAIRSFPALRGSLYIINPPMCEPEAKDHYREKTARSFFN